MRFQFSCVIVVFVLKTDAINLLLSLKEKGKKAKSAGVMNGIKQYKVRQRKGRPCLERFSAPVAQRA